MKIKEAYLLPKTYEQLNAMDTATLLNYITLCSVAIDLLSHDENHEWKQDEIADCQEAARGEFIHRSE